MQWFCSHRVTIVINEKIMAEHMAKISKQKRIPIEEEALRWTPLVQSGKIVSFFQIKHQNLIILT